MTKEEKRAYNQEYYRRNRDKLLARETRRYHKNRDAIRAQRKASRDANRETIRERARLHYQANRERICEQEKKRQKKLGRFRRYGLTREKYIAMVETQNGLCAICARECDIGDSLSIDHDHETGDVRGLLCRRCNSGLGFFRESAGLLTLASSYLEMAKRKRAA